MRLPKNLHLLLPALAAILLTLDLFLHAGEAATFDSPIHISVPYQVYEVMRKGEFPVTWLQSFARFGSPIPIFSHQIPMYITALLSFLTHDPVLSYKLVILLFSCIGSYGMYFFLRKHASNYAALAGMLLFTIAPYRALNLYTRGALPEFAAQSLLPLVLLAIYYFFTYRSYTFALMTSVAVASLVLTHPYMLIIGIPVIGLYSMYIALATRSSIKTLTLFGITVGCGLLMSGYYVLPLATEISYFYYGLETNHLKNGQFLTLSHYINNVWPYITESDIFPRPQVIMPGIIESIFVLMSAGVLLMKRNIRENLLPLSFAIAAAVYVFFTLEVSKIIYTNFPTLGSIQHPWRMIGGFSFAASVLAALVIHGTKYSRLAATVTIIACAVLYVPHLYGKNYTVRPVSAYNYSKDNLHSNTMSTIWAAEPKLYPEPKSHMSVIEGTGAVETVMEKSQSRTYRIKASTPVRIADATFYFPGWEVKADNEPVPIEFQDMNYRGLITYKLPPGNHTVIMTFQPTKKRQAGMAVSAAGVLGLVVLGLAHKKFMTTHV